MQLVNGYQCNNCTDIDYAKKNIDPAHPEDGPFGVNAKTSDGAAKSGSASDGPFGLSVVYGGSLASLNPTAQVNPTAQQDPLATNSINRPPADGVGATLNLSV